MSVLISDINKPTNCKECIFCVNDWCVINSRLHHIKGAEETTQYCPLIEIPPHGDLIDRDGLKSQVEDTTINAPYFKWLIENVPIVVESEE